MEALLKNGWTEVRATINVAALCAFLNGTGIWAPKRFRADRLLVLQSNNGMSNPTFYLQSRPTTPRSEVTAATETALIIRKKPPGKLLPGAHQIEREFRAMKHLWGTAVPVPRVHVLCDDETVLGQSFYVMDYVAGTVPKEPGLPKLASAQLRRKVFTEAIHILADLHNLDYVALGLQKHGKTGNYGARQLRTWSRQYELGDSALAAYEERVEADSASAASQLTRVGGSRPLSEQKNQDSKKNQLVRRVLKTGAGMRLLTEKLTNMMKDLEQRRKDSFNQTTLVHGDFRMGNFIIDESRGQIVAVLDWEISTLGHPFLDLAYLMSPWYFRAPLDARGDLSMGSYHCDSPMWCLDAQDD